MTTKSKSKSSKTTKAAPSRKDPSDSAMLDTMLASAVEAFRDAATSRIDKRKELLARVAGAVAAGLVTSPSPSIASPSGMATAAVDIAEEILKRAGIRPESSTRAVLATDEERYSKVLNFLMSEWQRTEARQLVGVDLLFSPGQGFRDEPLGSWERADEPEFFADPANVSKLAATIIDIAMGALDSKDPGKRRFIVRARQYMGSRPTMSFSLHAPAVGAAS